MRLNITRGVRLLKNDEHPVIQFLRSMRERYSDDYQERLSIFAARLGVSPVTIYNLANPKQSVRLGIQKALMFENLTDGAVPAESVCDHDIKHIISLALAVHLKRTTKPTGA